MTLSLEAMTQIRRMFFAEHWKVGTIAFQLGVHHDTVTHAVGLDSPRRVPPPANPARLLLTPFEPLVIETLETYPTLRATRLYDMLRARGYQGSARMLRRLVKKLRPVPRRAVYLRLETLAGEQAQVDWAMVGKRDVPGGRRDLWIFVMVLSFSRMLFVEFVWDLSCASLRRSLVRAHIFFGGSPRQWLFDNPRTVVLSRHGGVVCFHPTLLELAGQLHTEPRLCNVRAPQEKGKVERAVRFVRDRFLAGREIRDVAHGNAEIQHFLREIAPSRAQPTMPDKTVAQCFAIEGPRLLQLPSALPSLEQSIPVHVDSTSAVSFDGNQYSAPALYAGRTLTLAADDVQLRLLDGDVEKARHARSWGRRQRIEKPEHIASVLEHKKAARALKGRDRLHVEVPAIDVLLTRWAERGSHMASQVARTVGLLNLYGPVALNEAVAEALSRGLSDPRALGALCEQRRRAADGPMPTKIEFGAHVPERDVIQHDLGGYDERR